MKTRIALLLCFIFSLSYAYAQVKTYTVKSPDGKVELSVVADKSITWWLKHEDTEIITPSEISMTLDNGEVLGQNPVIKNTKAITEDRKLTTPIYKKTMVRDNYNQLTINFKGNYALVFRAYNDGVAYRFVTTKKGDITITNEEANFNFKDDDKAFLPFVNDYRNKDKFTTSYEAHYANIKLSEVVKDSLAFLPALVDVGNPKKAVILEADIEDYPGMYLTSDGSGKSGLHAVFARYPTKEDTGGYHNINYVVKERADYLAKTSGTRSFPWRVVVVSDEDKQLANNDMMQRLGAPSRIDDYSWIRPGKVAWDWWNDWNLSKVDFKAGVNIPTYKYYIDFAAANKLEYVIMDEGWSADGDLNQLKIDVPQIVEYGKQKNVGIILWSSWYALHLNADSIFSKYSKLGVKGFKIDFIDRDDQKMVNSLYDIAKKAAYYHLMVDYHGMFKPSGLQRTYPNIINFEGVKGLENMKWGVDNQPGYDVSIPYIRMIAGPMDYTPGGMRNATKSDFRPINNNPMTQGTRSHQMAMYVVFEAPLQMLADNPTIYKREQLCTDFIAAVPTTFDETAALDGKVGEFVSMARRKGTTWYAGAMTNWDTRAINVDLSFLGDGTYKATIFADGLNANHDATDYTTKTITVTAKDKLPVQMASGGGWAARFDKVN
jgi:alpha-glucosidase